MQNDLFSLTHLGEVTLDKYFDFLKAYKNEDNHLVLEDIYVNMRHIHSVFSHEKFWEGIWYGFKEHIKEPFERNFEKVGWDPKRSEDPSDTHMRTLCIAYLAFAEDKKILKKGNSKFSNFLKGKSLHPDIKGSVYSIAASEGNEIVFNKMVKLYERMRNPEEKLRLLGTLSRFKDPAILEKALDYSISDKVRMQDVRSSLPAIASNPQAQKIYFPWVKKNWSRLERLQKSSLIFMDILRSIITPYTGRDKEKEIREFLDIRVKGYKKTKANSFEVMQINTNWLEKNKKVLVRYFRK